MMILFNLKCTKSCMFKFNHSKKSQMMHAQLFNNAEDIVDEMIENVALTYPQLSWYENHKTLIKICKFQYCIY